MSEDSVNSEGDQRVANNTMRHQYRILSEEEKELMLSIKDKGAEFEAVLDGMAPSREVSLARTKIEEAVMWAVKGLTK